MSRVDNVRGFCSLGGTFQRPKPRTKPNTEVVYRPRYFTGYLGTTQGSWYLPIHSPPPGTSRSHDAPVIPLLQKEPTTFFTSGQQSPCFGSLSPVLCRRGTRRGRGFSLSSVSDLRRPPFLVTNPLGGSHAESVHDRVKVSFERLLYLPRLPGGSSILGSAARVARPTSGSRPVH